MTKNEQELVNAIETAGYSIYINVNGKNAIAVHNQSGYVVRAHNDPTNPNLMFSLLHLSRTVYERLREENAKANAALQGLSRSITSADYAP